MRNFFKSAAEAYKSAQNSGLITIWLLSSLVLSAFLFNSREELIEQQQAELKHLRPPGVAATPGEAPSRATGSLGEKPSRALSRVYSPTGELVDPPGIDPPPGARLPLPTVPSEVPVPPPGTPVYDFTTGKRVR